MSTLEKGRLDRFLDRVDELTQAPRATTLSSTEQIAAYIAERVQFGDLRPGERIRELEVAKYFGASRGPVRDALRLLERDGLVVLRGRRGAFVKDYSAQEMAAIYRIRAEIFGVTTRLAAESATRSSELLQALQEGGRLLIDLTEGHPVADYIRARRGISRTIAALAGNEYLAHVAASLEREISMLWAGLNAEDRRREASRLWQELIAAIVDRKGAAAEAKGREMVMNSLAAILKTRALAAVPLADAP